MKFTLKNAAIVSASVLLICITLLCLTGCNSINDPVPAVEDAIAAVRAYDTEKMGEYWGKSLANMKENDLVAKKICGGLRYKIVKSEVNEEKAYVTVEITNTDMASLSADLMNELYPDSHGSISAAQTEEQMALLLCRTGNKQMTKTVEIELRLEDGEWVITNNNSGAIYAMLGGMCSLEAVCPGVTMTPIAVSLSDTHVVLN